MIDSTFSSSCQQSKCIGYWRFLVYQGRTIAKTEDRQTSYKGRRLIAAEQA